MNCPVCNIPFITVERKNIEVEYCISCNGFWLDSGELELINEILGTNAKINSPFFADEIITAEKKYKCPKCKKIMKKVKINGIIIDVCPNNDGIWFDKNELSKVLNNSNKENGRIIKFLGEFFIQ